MPTMKMHLDLLPDFLRGTAFLGTGGGGDPYVGGLILRQKLEEGADITIMDPMELDDDDFVVSVANMGAPTVMVEKIPSAHTMVKCLRSIEREKGRKAAALIAAEAGGINGTLPMAIGAMTGLPVVDGDGMGRAFPELQMCTFGVYGVPASPIVLRDEHDNEVIVRARSNLESEWFARVVCTRMGTKSEIALYSMSGQEAKETGVLYTTTLAMEIGRSIREARETQSDPFAGLTHYFETSRDKRFCAVLFEGKVVDLLRETTQGWAIGRVRFEGIGESTGEQLEVRFQNEFLVAQQGGRTLAMVPDLICVLDQENAEPITTEGLKYGQRVRVVGVSVPPVMRTPEALAVFGPKYFGIADVYTPIEALV
ncbi:MAG: DUF917 domain-containing protein [Rhodospirillales bacterium]|nr:DUF917 domain-containing protein [Rhodospirillales bacterium]